MLETPPKHTSWGGYYYSSLWVLTIYVHFFFQWNNLAMYLQFHGMGLQGCAAWASQAQVCSQPCQLLAASSFFKTPRWASLAQSTLLWPLPLWARTVNWLFVNALHRTSSGILSPLSFLCRLLLASLTINPLRTMCQISVPAIEFGTWSKCSGVCWVNTSMS